MSSECSSIPDSKFFNNKYKYPKWFTRKKYIFHNKMLKRMRKLRFLHSKSSQYYEKMNIRLSAPSIFITSLSGIASFLSTSQYIDNDSQNAFGISVGVMASLSSIFQALSAACQYSVKKEAHRTVAEQYNALIVKTKFEMEMPNEKDFIDNLEQSILDIQAKCNYFVPQFILDEWTKNDEKTEKEGRFEEHTTNNISIYYDDDEDDNDSGNDDEEDNDGDDGDSEDDNDNDDDNSKNQEKQKKQNKIKTNPDESTYLLKKDHIELQIDNTDVNEAKNSNSKQNELTI